MQLIDELAGVLEREESLFRAQLLREDIARLRRLIELAQTTATAEAFRKAGERVGWTQGDARTAELSEPLGRLLGAVYDWHHGARNAEQELEIREAWQELHRVRMERLLGCLATPVPKPAG